MVKINKIHNMSLKKVVTKNRSIWQRNILSWYTLNKRKLPWRKKKYQNFYCIWLSEIMLQQTGVKVVKPYFIKFLKKWPNFKTFSKASLEEILFYWQGLGYYQRARNMFKAIDIIKNKKNLKSFEDFIGIPGVGDYTASSISAILYDSSKAVIDGNIKRILSRVVNLNPEEKSFIKNLNFIAQYLTPKKSNGIYCQALMDLGSLICKPKNPLCIKCPVNDCCDYYNSPKKRFTKNIIKNKKRKLGVAFYLNHKNLIYLEKSTNNFLHGLMKFPCSDFIDINNIYNSDYSHLEQKLILNFKKKTKLEYDKYEFYYIKHTFSDFYLKLLVVKIELKSKDNIKLNGIWMNKKQISSLPFSKLMEKVRIGFDKR